MKAVILAGGLGTRLSEETHSRPKPMVEIGGKPILWHIMKIFDSYGINEFIVCCGYKGFFIKEYFKNYHLRNTDVTFDLKNNSSKILTNTQENWSVTCVDTGENTLTGGRLKRIKGFLDPEESFLFTYGDGVGDINIKNLLEFHKSHGKLATVTAVNPPGRFGILKISENNNVSQFNEKPDIGNAWINGGFFVLQPSVIDYISGDKISWEEEPLQQITRDNQLSAYKHEGFWQPMDTIAEKKYLEKLYVSNKAPWRMWD
ncbi:glucose-1-phosphate cytidylyltransferase [Pseudomonadota bacterium]|jgi:glucose-1-phosphate cytidylyltransferase|nr:glucose-1-phosphate cytidylyltransferase [Pseudomonadota bacterium]